jgi:drug/metabolite transporter (DMT)-like permease
MGLMSATTVFLVLFAALLHASWNAFAKTGSDPTLSIACFHVVAAVIAIPIIFLVPLPNVECIPYLLASVVMHWAYMGLLGKAYRFGDLSHVYPLSRGTAPLIVTIVSALLFKEVLPNLTVFGILLTCSGIILLSFKNGLSLQQDRRPVALSLGTSLSIAAYTIIDGLGVRQSIDPISYIVWLFTLAGITFGLFTVFVQNENPKQALRYFKQQRWVMLTGGIATAGAYGIVIYAMAESPMAMVSALRETSVLIGIIIGVVILKERFGKLGMGAVMLVGAGVFIMNLIR